MPTEAELLEACAASGQMDSRQVAAHVEAGEMEPPKLRCAVHGMVRPGAMCSKVIVGMELCGFAGHCEHQRAATPLPTHPQQEKTLG